MNKIEHQYSAEGTTFNPNECYLFGRGGNIPSNPANKYVRSYVDKIRNIYASSDKFYKAEIKKALLQNLKEAGIKFGIVNKHGLFYEELNNNLILRVLGELLRPKENKKPVGNAEMNGCVNNIEPISVEYLPNGGVADKTNQTNQTNNMTNEEHVPNMARYNKGAAGYPSNDEVPDEVRKLLGSYQGMTQKEMQETDVSFVLEYLNKLNKAQDCGKGAS